MRLCSCTTLVSTKDKCPNTTHNSSLLLTLEVCLCTTLTKYDVRNKGIVIICITLFYVNTFFVCLLHGRLSKTKNMPLDLQFYIKSRNGIALASNINGSSFISKGSKLVL